MTVFVYFFATCMVNKDEYNSNCLYLAGNLSLRFTVKTLGNCYEIQYTWTARSTETETETGLDRYVMLGARWLTEY